MDQSTVVKKEDVRLFAVSVLSWCVEEVDRFLSTIPGEEFTLERALDELNRGQFTRNSVFHEGSAHTCWCGGDYSVMLPWGIFDTKYVQRFAVWMKSRNLRNLPL